MSKEQTIEVVKVLLKYIGNDLEQDKAIAQGALVILGGLDPEEPAPSKPKKETPKAAPRKRKPFDTGKMRALLDGGWPVAKIADEMGCSVGTIYDHMKKEGIAVGKQ